MWNVGRGEVKGAGERVAADRPVPITVDGALAVFRDQLGHLDITADGAGAGQPQLRATLRTACDCARREGVPPEALLVRLKEAMSTTARLDRQLPERDAELRASLVSFAILEYYSDEKVIGE
jgi:hypothetical protein